MVLQRMRATSYLRRTMSDPFSRRRTTLPYIVGIFSQKNDLYKNLINTGISKNSFKETKIPNYTWKSDAIAVLDIFFTKLNILFLFVPFGVLSYYLEWGALATFWFNFIALIPLANLLGIFTEELALHTGEVVGGLLNATFGNAVEAILTVQGIRAGLITVVQGTLLGSILSNLLLVLGMSFFAGGIFHHVQKFNEKGASFSTSLLMLSCMAISIPTIVAQFDLPQHNILMISRLTAILLSFTYVLFLFFQLYTHINLFRDESIASNDKSYPSYMIENISSVKYPNDLPNIEIYNNNIYKNYPIISQNFNNYQLYDVCLELPTISWQIGTVLILLCTILISIISECLVDSINGFISEWRFSENFIGVILLPLVGNAAEHITAVSVAIKNKTDLTIGVAIGSSTQIALFVVPFSVIVGWLLGKPMTLSFTPVSAIILLLTNLIVIGIVQDGESNWFEGILLIISYCIVAVVYWYI
ncbi:Sodium/calcium exchanger protein family protein [Cryptosporidium meleagridis]|uniref:Sodium/calcium exchanger protein family protein n=1 Tax=Cryptosporidium meleagridis TaxID=93969 RepID=A0A2P4YWG8_9CRYT|nr:Sodium/calcium exchanger protein family protein [Cryptosporidium meleagridis]